MSKSEHLSILLKGVDFWNRWRKDNPEIRPNLGKADIAGAGYGVPDIGAVFIGTSVDLRGINFSNTYLEGANLSGVDLRHAHFDGANLQRVNLSSSNLSNVDLSRRGLEQADFTGATMEKTILIGARMYNTNLTRAKLQGADLRKADLSCAIMVETNLRNADLTNCSVYGVSVWGVDLSGAKMLSLRISSLFEPSIQVDDLEVAQFIYLLLNYKKLRKVIDAVTARGVLLLGRFENGGIDVLNAIASKLRDEKYQPIIFDFQRPDHRNYTETIKTLVGLVRFVIVDLSGPSVPQELYATVPHFKIPFIPIIGKGKTTYSLDVDILEYPWVLSPPREYESIDDLTSTLHVKIISPAEAKVAERQALLKKIFPKK